MTEVLNFAGKKLYVRFQISQRKWISQDMQLANSRPGWDLGTDKSTFSGSYVGQKLIKCRFGQSSVDQKSPQPHFSSSSSSEKLEKGKNTEKRLSSFFRLQRNNVGPDRNNETEKKIPESFGSWKKNFFHKKLETETDIKKVSEGPDDREDLGLSEIFCPEKRLSFF